MKPFFIFFIVFLSSLPAVAQTPTPTRTPIPVAYVEMLVKTSDNAMSKLSRDQWTDEMRREHRAANARQGYIINMRPAGWDWGRMERDPKRFAIVSIPARHFNPEWLDPILDATGDIVQEREYRLPLESFMSTEELDTLKSRPYNDSVQRPLIFRTIEDVTTMIIVADHNKMPTPWVSHGSSGLFTIAESGGDYTTVLAWESAEDGDLTGTGPSIAEVSGSFSSAETVRQLIGGWTSTVTDWIEIRSATDGNSRHVGIWDDTLHRWEVDNNDVIALGESYIRLHGLQMNATAVSGNGDNVIQSSLPNADSAIYISHNLIRGDPHDTDDSQRGIDAADGDIDEMFIWNNIFFEFTGEDPLDFVLRGGSAAIYLYNNTMVGGDSSIGGADANTVHAKNNILYAMVGAAMDGTFDTNSEFNSTDYSALEGGGSGNRVDQTFTFAGESDNPPNFLLASGDGGAKDFGTDLSGDGNLPFTDDILENTRPDDTTWDIGAHEEGAGGPTPTPTNTPTNTPTPAVTPTPVNAAQFWRAL